MHEILGDSVIIYGVHASRKCISEIRALAWGHDPPKLVDCYFSLVGINHAGVDWWEPCGPVRYANNIVLLFRKAQPQLGYILCEEFGNLDYPAGIEDHGTTLPQT